MILGCHAGCLLGLAGALTVLPFTSFGSDSGAEEPPVARELESAKTIPEVTGLLRELEAQAELQRNQLRRTEASLTRARALLADLQDRQRHALLPAQSIVEKMEWRWIDEHANPRYCAEHVGAKYSVDVANPQFDPWSLTIRVSDGGKEVYSWKGNSHSVFALDADVLYYADFNPHRSGCAVVAYDLKGGKRLWRTKLWGVGAVDHSKYGNRINLAIADKNFVVYGNESFGRYIELLDLRTGKTIGHKLISKGYVRPKSHPGPE